MYQIHSTFSPPESEEIKVWRYMDFTKFVSLIDSRCLYFSRSDKFDDPFEGSTPKRNQVARIEAFGLTNISDKACHDLNNMVSDATRSIKKFVAINCWHTNEHESAAMWKLYLKSNEGIAIQSTYKKLRDSIIDDRSVFLGKVKYIDYEHDVIQDSNALALFIHKRKSFEHEREIRAVLMFPPTPDTPFTEQEPVDHGFQINIDIITLIEKIYIAPGTPQWFTDLVRAVTARYGYKFEVVQSKLNEQPIF